MRTVSFELAPALAARWNDGSLLRSAWLNALSLFLPTGEAFFVETVRGAPCDARPMASAVSAFVMQESAHRRQHELYNRCVCTQFRSAQRWVDYMDRSWALKRALMSERKRLAATVVIEHLTTIIARLILTESSLLAGADAEYANLWKWHALEELEHKAVAFDLYLARYGSRRGLTATMIIVSLVFALEYAAVLASLLFEKRETRRLATFGATFAVLRSDPVAALRRQYFEFFRSGYSPSAIDDTPVVLRWRREDELQRHVLKSRRPGAYADGC